METNPVDEAEIVREWILKAIKRLDEQSLNTDLLTVKKQIDTIRWYLNNQL
jgi:hypothetical protein